MGPQILKSFYSCTIGNCSASDRKALQRVVRMAQYITGAKLPAIQDLYTMCQRKAPKIILLLLAVYYLCTLPLPASTNDLD